MDPILFGFGFVYLMAAGALVVSRRESGWAGTAGFLVTLILLVTLAFGGYLIYLSLTLPEGA